MRLCSACLARRAFRSSRLQFQRRSRPRIPIRGSHCPQTWSPRRQLRLLAISPPQAQALAGLWMSATSPRRPRAGASDLKPASLCRANPAPRWAFQAMAEPDRWLCRPPAASTADWADREVAQASVAAMGLAAAFPAKVPAQERKVVVAVQTKWRAVGFHLIRGQAAQAAAQVVIRPCLELL